MGTYININAYVVMKPENEQLAVQSVRDLNKRDDLKRGGGFKGNEREVWFSWLPEKYEDSIHSIEDIFGPDMLGFDVSKRVTEDGRYIYDMSYYDKWGQHELFFIAIGPYMEEMIVDHYCDELDFPEQVWRIELDQETKKVHLLEPEITIQYPVPSDGNVLTYDYYKPVIYTDLI